MTTEIRMFVKLGKKKEVAAFEYPALSSLNSQVM